jgi:hypothetical protein
LTRYSIGQKFLFTKAPFWEKFGQIWALFSPNDWSHWSIHSHEQCDKIGRKISQTDRNKFLINLVSFGAKV